MKTKKSIRLHGLSQKKIRRKKGNKRIQIKNKNKIRKKIYFKKRKLIHNDNNSNEGDAVLKYHSNNSSDTFKNNDTIKLFAKI